MGTFTGNYSHVQKFKTIKINLEKVHLPQKMHYFSTLTQHIAAYQVKVALN